MEKYVLKLSVFEHIFLIQKLQHWSCLDCNQCYIFKIWYDVNAFVCKSCVEGAILHFIGYSKIKWVKKILENLNGTKALTTELRLKRTFQPADSNFIYFRPELLKFRMRDSCLGHSDLGHFGLVRFSALDISDWNLLVQDSLASVLLDRILPLDISIFIQEHFSPNIVMIFHFDHDSCFAQYTSRISTCI